MMLLSEMYKDAMDWSLRAADAIAPEDRFRPVKPGRAHTVWLLGHMANTLNEVLLHWVLGGERALPTDWPMDRFAPSFRGGLAVVDDPAVYPSWEKVREAYVIAMTTTISRLESLTEIDLSKPPSDLAPDQLKARWSTVGSAVTFLVQHDAYHRGQIAFATDKVLDV